MLHANVGKVQKRNDFSNKMGLDTRTNEENKV